MTYNKPRGRGRRRALSTVVPSHIDPTKLPQRCYWDPSGRGHWYTKFTVDGKSRRAKIAGPTARLSDLHKIMEHRNGVTVDCLNWLWSKFKESPQFTQLSKSSQDDWSYCSRIIEQHPTKIPGLKVGQVALVEWTPVLMQKLIDQIAKTRGPSAAAHTARYLRRICNWSVLRGYLRSSPVPERFEMPKERQLRRLPTKLVVSNLVTFGQESAGRPAHTKGSCAAYIPWTLVLASRCRLRGIEVFDLTDASLVPAGIVCRRRKGSQDNITQWTPELRQVVQAAQAYRNQLWSEQGRPVPMDPAQRYLLVTDTGGQIKSSTWQSAWRRFLASAIAAGVITEDERFGLHDMKRRGATDTKGTKAQKMDATGHKSRSELDKYDFELPIVAASED